MPRSWKALIKSPNANEKSDSILANLPLIFIENRNTNLSTAGSSKAEFPATGIEVYRQFVALAANQLESMKV